MPDDIVKDEVAHISDDVESAIKAAIDRENVDHRVNAEAMTTYYNTLMENSRMSEGFAQHLTQQYQLFLFTDDADESDDGPF